jgi:hypothetical protein
METTANMRFEPWSLEEVHSTYANILKNICKKVKKIVGIG